MLEKVFAVPATRFLFVLAATYAVVQARQPPASDLADASMSVLPTIFETVAGLLTYKVAVLLVSALGGSSIDEQEQEREREEDRSTDRL